MYAIGFEQLPEKVSKWDEVGNWWDKWDIPLHPTCDVSYRLEFPHPDIPKTDGAVVSGEDDRSCAFVVTMAGQNAVAGFAVDLLIEMHEDAVVKHGDARRGNLLFIFELGSRKKDVN